MVARFRISHELSLSISSQVDNTLASNTDAHQVFFTVRRVQSIPRAIRVGVHRSA